MTNNLAFNITRDRFEALRVHLASIGLSLAGDHGIATGPHGVVIHFDYAEPVLSVRVEASFILIHEAIKRVSDEITPYETAVSK